MKETVNSPEIGLPGYDTLRQLDTDIQLDESIYDMADTYQVEGMVRSYLKNPAYDQYMRMHKVLVGESGAGQLLTLADKLVQESLPKYLDAAGWAYMEAGLALHDQPTSQRIEMATLAEDCWQRSLLTSRHMVGDEVAEVLYEDADQFRTAINLAFSPILKSMMAGNVTESTRRRAFADTLAIAQTSNLQFRLAKEIGSTDAMTDYIGFMHECNVLLALLRLDNPSYVPCPSFDRSDSGLYNPNQSHDIIIFNQHWGKIKKVIPVEVKSKASKAHRDRYRALLVRGKMHMIIGSGCDPAETLQAFASIYDGSDKPADRRIVTYASDNIRELLRLYQKGQRNGDIKTSSSTTFHDKRYVEHMYKGAQN